MSKHFENNWLRRIKQKFQTNELGHGVIVERGYIQFRWTY
jgi:hypothetical protein